MNPADFSPIKSPAALQPDWAKPKFCNSYVAFHMNMCRLITVTSVEKEPVRANPEHRRHLHHRFHPRIEKPSTETISLCLP